MFFKNDFPNETILKYGESKCLPKDFRSQYLREIALDTKHFVIYLFQKKMNRSMSVLKKKNKLKKKYFKKEVSERNKK